MRKLIEFTLLVALSMPALAHAMEPCQRIHGRAHYYYADGQFRLWHIGTHHEFSLQSEDGPDANEKLPVIEGEILKLLRADAKEPIDVSNNDLFADFIVCPTEPYVRGRAQGAKLKDMRRVKVVSKPFAPKN